MELMLGLNAYGGRYEFVRNAFKSIHKDVDYFLLPFFLMLGKL